MKNRETAVAWGAVALFAAGVGLAKLPPTHVDFPPWCSCAALANCGGGVPDRDCSCCRNGPPPALFGCTACTATFDCLNPPSPWVCSDAI